MNKQQDKLETSRLSASTCLGQITLIVCGIWNITKNCKIRTKTVITRERLIIF